MKNNTLTPKEIAELKARAHHLHAVVLIGQNGLTDAVIKETDCHLAAHELIKVQVAGDERSERLAVAAALCSATGAELVQHIGKQLVLYRRKPE